MTKILRKVGIGVVSTFCAALVLGLSPFSRQKLSPKAITYVVPHARINFPANITGTEAHNWSAGIATATSIAHKGEVTGAKVLVGSMIDLMTKPEQLIKAKEWFDKGLAEAGIVYTPPSSTGDQTSAEIES
jgi:hypothetical protein